MVYLSFHPTRWEMKQGKVELLYPFFEMVVDSYGWPEQEPGTFEGGRDLMVHLLVLDISPWSPGVQKYSSGRHVYQPCMLSSAIIIEYEFKPESLNIFSAQLRCKRGMSFCVEPLPKPRAVGSWTYKTIKACLGLRRMQFNGFPVMVTTGRTGSELFLALQPYAALGGNFKFPRTTWIIMLNYGAA